MTKQEFIQQYKARRPSLRRAFVVVGIAFGFMLSLPIWAPRTITYLQQGDNFKWAASFDDYWVVGFFGFCLLFIGFAWRIASKPQGGLDCPACGRRLWGTSAQIALFVGNCGYCGETVVEDPMVKKTLRIP